MTDIRITRLLTRVADVDATFLTSFRVIRGEVIAMLML